MDRGEVKTYHLVPKWRIFYGVVGAFWVFYLDIKSQSYIRYYSHLMIHPPTQITFP